MRRLHRHYPLFSRSTTFGYISGSKKISTVREFRANVQRLLRSKTPILVTRRGGLAGIFFPRPETTLPIELKRGLYDTLSADTARQLKRRRVFEGEVLRDFEASRKTRRTARRQLQIGNELPERLSRVLTISRR